MFKGSIERIIASNPQENRGSAPRRTPESKKHNKLAVVGLFAGVGGLEAGFRKAGFTSKMLCEIDPEARKILIKRFPGARITSDIRSLARLPVCDVITAGFPCQDLSQVGRRKGIRGPNSGLIDHVFDLIRDSEQPPRWLVLENVPFMLKLDQGRAIARITRKLEEMGWMWAYRTLDAQAFGLPQRRRRVILIASKTRDPRPILFNSRVSAPPPPPRGRHACGFYWTEGNTGLGWAVDATPPLKGGSALHIPSPPAIWFPKSRRIVIPSIEDAERLQGFRVGWTAPDGAELRAHRARWRLVGNAVSVPLAEWIARRLSTTKAKYRDSNDNEFKGPPWPDAAWGKDGKRASVAISEWPTRRRCKHLASFLKFPLRPLSVKAAAGFHARLVESQLRYDAQFERDLRHHISKHAKKSAKRSGKRKHD